MKINKIRFKCIATLVGCAMQLSACTVGPDYVKPTAEVPAAYLEIGEWKLAKPKDEVIRGAWWEVFNDPQLNSLEEQVAVSNQNVLEAEALLRQAYALVRAAQAGYAPAVSTGASATRSRRSSNLVTGQVSDGGITNDYQLPINVSWELDLWGRIRRTVEAGQANAQASSADLAAVRLSAQAELAMDYFQLCMLDAQKELLESTVSYYQKSLDLTKNRYAGGIAAKADVLLAETQLKSTQAQSIDTDIQTAQLRHAIAVLTGRPASGFALSPLPKDVAPPAIPVGLPSELLEQRPDIAMAERRVAAANAQIGVTEAAFFPAVKLSASGGLEASSLTKWASWPSRFWAVGPSVSQQLFDGGLRMAQGDQARAAYDATVASYRQTVLTGFQEVEDNLAALRILEEEGRVQDEAVRAAEQTTAMVTNQYKAGTTSYLSVIITQAAELANKRTAVGILGRRMSASVSLIKALGGGWDPSSLRMEEARAQKK